MITFVFGFEYKGFFYGWHKKELYRLPSSSGNKHYGFKKLELIRIGQQFGYRLKKDRATIEQLRQITVAIQPVKISLIKHEDCPF